MVGIRRTEIAGKDLKIKDCGKKEETRNFSSIDSYETETMLGEEESLHSDKTERERESML
jgi:hypothetical protein